MTLLSLFKGSNTKVAHTLISGNDAFLNEYLADSYIHETEFSAYEKVSVDCDSEGLDELIADLTESMPTEYVEPAKFQLSLCEDDQNDSCDQQK